MSFRAYLDNIEARTGKSADALASLAVAKGLAADGNLGPGVKAGQVIAWLKGDYGLGHGHAMAIVAYIKGKREQDHAN